jgi:hypothetical protein
MNVLFRERKSQEPVTSAEAGMPRNAHRRPGLQFSSILAEASRREKEEGSSRVGCGRRVHMEGGGERRLDSRNKAHL